MLRHDRARAATRGLCATLGLTLLAACSGGGGSSATPVAFEGQYTLLRLTDLSCDESRVDAVSMTIGPPVDGVFSIQIETEPGETLDLTARQQGDQLIVSGTDRLAGDVTVDVSETAWSRNGTVITGALPTRIVDASGQSCQSVATIEAYLQGPGSAPILEGRHLWYLLPTVPPGGDPCPNPVEAVIVDFFPKGPGSSELKALVAPYALADRPRVPFVFDASLQTASASGAHTLSLDGGDVLFGESLRLLGELQVDRSTREVSGTLRLETLSGTDACTRSVEIVGGPYAGAPEGLWNGLRQLEDSPAFRVESVGAPIEISPLGGNEYAFDIFFGTVDDAVVEVEDLDQVVSLVATYDPATRQLRLPAGQSDTFFEVVSGVPFEVLYTQAEEVVFDSFGVDGTGLRDGELAIAFAGEYRYELDGRAFVTELSFFLDDGTRFLPAVDLPSSWNLYEDGVLVEFLSARILPRSDSLDGGNVVLSLRGSFGRLTLGATLEQDVFGDQWLSFAGADTSSGQFVDLESLGAGLLCEPDLEQGVVFTQGQIRITVDGGPDRFFSIQP